MPEVAINIPKVPARELPVQTWSEWQSVSLVKSAIRALEQGVFDAASQVVDAMGRDDRIDGCKLSRVQALPSLPVSFTPPKNADARKKLAIRSCEENFEKICPDHAIAELLEWGIFIGIGVGQLIWDTSVTPWMPRLRVWHPRFLRWRWDTRAYHLSTEGGEVQVVPGNGEWVLFTPYGLDRAWMRGKVRSLHVPWLIRQWGMRDMARNSEVHGMPIRKAVMPMGAQGDDKDRFLKEVANLGQESIIMTPRVSGTTGDNDRYDIELLEATTNSSETFEKLLEMANTCVSINILGQNLTTEVKGGSFAATKGHMQIRQDVLQGDAENIGACLQTQVLGPFCERNYGDRNLAPKPTWKTRPPDDKVQKGQALKNLGEGAMALKKVGVKVDLDKLAEDDEIPTTGPAEDVDVNAIQGPGGPAAGEGVGPQPGSGKLPRPKQPIARATRADEIPDALYEGQLYADELTDNATELSKAAMRGDVRALLSLIDKAESYEDIRTGLLKLYKGMSRDKLAKLVKQTLVLAKLAGRFAVAEEAKED